MAFSVDRYGRMGGSAVTIDAIGESSLKQRG
jgi:hypothetical protein